MLNAILSQNAPYFFAVSDIAFSSRWLYKSIICKSSIHILLAVVMKAFTYKDKFSSEIFLRNIKKL
jgi:hypothetical protein